MGFCGDQQRILFSAATRRLVKDALIDFKKHFLPVHGYLATTICVFGVVANVLHIFVLTSKLMRKSSVNCLLTAVAVCDLGTMLSYLCYLVYFVLLPSHSDLCWAGQNYNMAFFAIVHVFVSIFLHSASLWLVVALALTRTMTLRQRIIRSPWHNNMRALKMSLLIFAAVLFCSLPNLMLQKITERKVSKSVCTRELADVNLTTTLHLVHLSKVARDNGCKLLKVDLWIIGLLFKVIPCILLLMFSAVLVYKLRKTRALSQSLQRSHTTARKKRTRAHRQADHTTIMLLMILFVFLVTELPQGLLAIMSALYIEDVYFYIYGGIADLLDLLALVNSSVNFLLYCLMSSRYRQAFRKLILPEFLQIRWGTENENGEQPSCTVLAMHSTARGRAPPLKKRSQSLQTPSPRSSTVRQVILRKQKSSKGLFRSVK